MAVIEQNIFNIRSAFFSFDKINSIDNSEDKLDFVSISFI